MGRGNGQTDGGASAYDAAKARRTARAEAPPIPWPDGCKGCDYTGRREVAEHRRSRVEPDVVLHLAACGCARGKMRTDRQGVPAFFTVKDAVETRGNLAILDPSPRQRTLGGEVPIVIPALGSYVPRNPVRGGGLRILAQPRKTREEALLWLGRNPDGSIPGEAPPPFPVPAPAPVALPACDEPPFALDAPPWPEPPAPTDDDAPPFPIDDEAQLW